MFDIEEFVRDAAVAADPGTLPLGRLKAVLRLKSLLDAAEAELVATMAEEHGWSDRDEFDVVGARAVRLGADGSRLLAEDLPLELAMAQGVSVGAATWYLRDVVNLDARHPHTWHAVHDGRLPLWRAREIARICADAGLSRAQTRQVDEALEPVVGRVGWRRTVHMLRAAMMIAAPEIMTAQAERQPRFCRKQATDDTGTAMITAMVDTADAVFFDATVQRLAEILAEHGDADDTDHRRAKAVGILATPAHALDLLGTHTRRGIAGHDPADHHPACHHPACHDPAGLPRDDRSPDERLSNGLPPDGCSPTAGSPTGQHAPIGQRAASHLPVCKIYVHVHAETLAAGVGVARVEDAGPILVGQLAKIVGNANIKLTPVVHLADAPDPAVDTYEIPQRIRDSVVLRDRFEAFPFSSREARHLDLDHTVPWRPGQPGLTRASNLGPLSRRTHRAKTHCGWQLIQTAPGTFWWRSPLGQIARVSHDGTQRIDFPNPWHANHHLTTTTPDTS